MLKQTQQNSSSCFFQILKLLIQFNANSCFHYELLIRFLLGFFIFVEPITKLTL
jgi:hypothetical protein